MIHLGKCFNLLESHCLEVLQESYYAMETTYEHADIEMPFNDKAYSLDTDKLYRNLDCAVIEFMHSHISRDVNFDSVRGAFWEGKELYPNAGFKEKNHIQLCVRNPNCIKGYFKPLEIDSSFPPV